MSRIPLIETSNNSSLIPSTSQQQFNKSSSNGNTNDNDQKTSTKKIKIAFDPTFFKPKDFKRKRKSVESSNNNNYIENDNYTNEHVNEHQLKKFRESIQYLSKSSIGIHKFYNQIRSGGRVNPNKLNLLKPYLSSFRLYNDNDNFNILSRLNGRMYAPPLTTTFVPSTRNSLNPILVVGDEEGTVSYIDGQKSTFHSKNSRFKSSIEAHENAIFDLKFNEDSRYFCTASADQEIRLWDTETKTNLGSCQGHTGSVKSLSWSGINENLFASASRDGSIKIWDIRLPNTSNNIIDNDCYERELEPKLSIDKAHASLIDKRKRTNIGRSVTRSVTTISFLNNSDHLIASAGSANGSVKIWDIRSLTNKRTKLSKPAFEYIDPTESNGRPHGVSNIQVDGNWIWSLCTNSIIYGYPINNDIDRAIVKLQDKELTCASFWIRMAISQCGRYLSCGSKNGIIFNWDISNVKRSYQSPLQNSTHKLYHNDQNLNQTNTKSQSIEVGFIDWAHDTLVSCSDDTTVKFWRPVP